MTEYKVICADSHVNPPPDFWQEYLPSSLRDLAPKIEQGEDADYVVFEGRRKKLNLIGAQAGRDGKNFKIEGRLKTPEYVANITSQYRKAIDAAVAGLAADEHVGPFRARYESRGKANQWRLSP